MESNFCNICLRKEKLYRFDNLEICHACFEIVKKLEKEKPFEIDKFQKAGALKDEL